MEQEALVCFKIYRDFNLHFPFAFEKLNIKKVFNVWEIVRNWELFLTFAAIIHSSLGLRHMFSQQQQRDAAFNNKTKIFIIKRKSINAELEGSLNTDTRK